MTDTAIADGDFAPAANGRPYRIGGTRELFQRAAIRLTVPRGSFCYDPGLGGKLGTLTGKESNLDAKALTLAQEALRALPEVTAQSAEYRDKTPPEVRILLACGGETKEIGVIL